MSRRSEAESPLWLRVQGARYEAPGVTSYELASPDGMPLPAWDPGAHVDVHLPSGTVRQYSLCGDPADLSRYRIAVLELPDGRGGSREAHRELRPGRELRIGHPRLEFALADAQRYVFVAGGIGVTPILPMVREAERRGADCELVYAARAADRFAFRDELLALAGGRRARVRLVSGPLDVAAVVAESVGAAVHACGPSGLLDALSDAMAAAGRAGELRLERFVPTALAVPADGSGGFEVELASSGRLVDVPPDRSVLDAVRAAGVDVTSSCEMGICGTCETKVIAGEVDHRDDLLTDAEKAAGTSMLICVSRAACPRLVLGL